MHSIDINDLKEKFPHLDERLGKLEKRAKIAEILLELKDHGGMKILLAELESIIQGINTKLLSFDKMTEQERELLLTDKSRCLWLINHFPNQEQVLKNIENYIKKL